MSDITIKRKQDLAKKAQETMLARLIDFTPCHLLTVGQVLWIAAQARDLAFDALSEITKED